MNVKNVEKENGAAKVTIEIARDEFQTALDKAYAKIRKDIMIPGFRKGKTPRFGEVADKTAMQSVVTEFLQ